MLTNQIKQNWNYTNITRSKFENNEIVVNRVISNFAIGSGNFDLFFLFELQSRHGHSNYDLIKLLFNRIIHFE